MKTKIEKKEYPKVLRSNPKLKWYTVGLTTVARPKMIPIAIPYLLAVILFKLHGFVMTLFSIVAVFWMIVVFKNALAICKEELCCEMNGEPATKLREKVDREAARSDKGIAIGAIIGIALAFFAGLVTNDTGAIGTCPYCGAYVEAGETYCPHCGNPL